MKKVSIIEMDYDEFEEIVKRVYQATKYSFVATEECGNDSSHTFDITKKEPLDKYEKEDLDEFVASKGLKTYVNQTLFQDLVNKGKLKPGHYLVNVCG
jgi:hypothetical protein